MEGLLKIEVPRLTRGSSTQPAEASQAPQLGATDPHAPGAKMTVVNKLPQNILAAKAVDREFCIYRKYGKNQ